MLAAFVIAGDGDHHQFVGGILFHECEQLLPYLHRVAVHQARALLFDIGAFGLRVAMGAGRIRLDPAQFMVRVPTLVIWGDLDGALLPGNLRGLEACVPDLTVKRIPEGSHWVIHERPDEVNALIRDFVSA